MDGRPQYPILIPVGGERKHRAGMPFVGLRPAHERRLVQFVVIESIDTSFVALAPEVQQLAFGGAFPVDDTMQMRASYLKALKGMLIAEMSEVIGIDQIKYTLFSSSKHQMLAWDQGGSRGVQIIVILV